MDRIGEYLAHGDRIAFEGMTASMALGLFYAKVRKTTWALVTAKPHGVTVM
jgi:hypothetical protein